MRVTHTIHDLAGDLRQIPPQATIEARQLVRKNAHKGSMEARRIARAKGGPHGKKYFKRITSEMTGPFEAEWGPEGDPKTEFVGAGWRHGVNLDMPQSLDLIKPKFARDVNAMLDRLFW